MRYLYGWIDPHTHMDERGPEDFRMMGIAGVRNVVSLAHPPMRVTTPEILLEHYHRILEFEVRRGIENGINVLAGIGIHPSAIPEDEVEKVFRILPEILKEERVVCIGEIGLQNGMRLEELIFQSHLELSDSHPLIIHTPRRGKEEILKRTLEILEEFSIKPERVLIDHLDDRTLKTALEFGAYGGLTVQPGKLQPEDIPRILENCDEEEMRRLVVDSDLGAYPSDPLSVAKVAHLLISSGHEKEAKLLCSENARRFLKI
ncbi:MAG: TatD family hydrolase [Archaeoglobi archaeon]|nr:TatD family hydrolase [Candidatus Mnemosynella sp.]